eukprot:CAMPEP_0180491332 /NCGR_PEP_ID=MMETSP1036_2-20121128/39590_1 /TAXON_ID=632150 /ORGANISM="Azadinium spinosum, Strain 3D9" /LENGTH=117 /DNA_ID=CAMNT_0022499581 /DNA_START=186 /DNA_END=540 /DNA_ORIENTATION=+
MSRSTTPLPASFQARESSTGHLSAQTTSMRKHCVHQANATELGGHNAQDRDLKSVHIDRDLAQDLARTMRTVPWVRAAPHTDTRTHRKGDADLTKDCGTPIERAALQHLVALSCASA